MEKHKGSCFCQKVKYEVNIDLSEGTIRCNCTYCLKTRQWGSYVPSSNFTITEGKDELTKFVGKNNGGFFFCRHCGTRIYSETTWDGNKVSINVNTLDDLDRKQFSELKITYIDGYNETWESLTQDTNYL